MTIPEIDRICFVGAGTMGCFNALMAGSAGYEAVVYDVSKEILDALPDALSGMAGFLANHGLIDGAAIPAILSRIRGTAELEAAVQGVGLVSESVSERLEIKRTLHSRLDQICDSTTLITTNTSGLLVSQIQDVFSEGDRFAAQHSHLGSRLFDIVGSARTSPDAIDTLKRYVISLECTPLVLKKENPGYVLNAMLGPLLTASQLLVINGVTTIEGVDRVWMANEEAPVGPFGLMDLFGLNVVADSWQHPKPNTEHLQATVLNFLAPYLDAGHLGIKTGRGFYQYPDPAYAQSDFVGDVEALGHVYKILSAVLVSNAIVLVTSGIADPSDIDRAWTLSFGVPRGPFGLLEMIGSEAFHSTYCELVAAGLLPKQPAEQVAEYLQV